MEDKKFVYGVLSTWVEDIVGNPNADKTGTTLLACFTTFEKAKAYIEEKKAEYIKQVCKDWDSCFDELAEPEDVEVEATNNDKKEICSFWCSISEDIGYINVISYHLEVKKVHLD